MIFSLDVRRARKGDCLILHYGSKSRPGLMLIDGGPSTVYALHLKPRLEQIRKARDVPDDEPLVIDILMVSHVDDDHIRGILDMTRELIEAQDARRPLPVRVIGMWHNSFDDIIRGEDTETLTAALKGPFGAAALHGELPNDATIDADDGDLDEEAIVGSLKVLASIPQGFRLRGDAARLGIPPNLEFGGELIVAETGATPVEFMPGGLSLTVAGPLHREIEELREKHEKWLKDLKKKGKSPSEALAAYVDRSVANLSSLVVVAEAEGGSMLLTGDARGDKILKGLETVGILEPGGKRHFDLLKVPHHGSSNNLDDDFFERITADHYVFSGNGEHGNPERKALAMLLKARGDAAYMVHLTYPIAEIDAARKLDWNKERNKEKAKQLKNPDKEIRKPWSNKRNSLGAFFTAHPAFAARIEIVDKDKPHVIDIGEPLGDAWPELV